MVRRIGGNLAAMGAAFQLLRNAAATAAEVLAEFAMSVAGMQSMPSGPLVRLPAPAEGTNEQSPVQAVEALRSPHRGVSVDVARIDEASERREQADGQ